MRLKAAWRSRDVALGLALLAVAVLPLVLPPVPIAGDLPKHLMIARVYSAYDSPLFRFPEYFELNPRPVPTALVTVFLALAMKLVTPYAAGKLFFAAAAFGLWFFSRGLVRALGMPAAAALLVLPLTNSGFTYSGMLGYYGSLCLYPALLWVLVSRLRGTLRSFTISAVLLALYGFHVVGWAVGCLAVMLFAVAPLLRIESGEARQPRVDWALMAAALVTWLPFLFFAASESRFSQAIWLSPLGQIKALFGYTVTATTKLSAIPLLVGIAALMAAAAAQFRDANTDRRFVVLGAALMLLGIVLPQHYGAFTPMGPRVMPFALISLVGALRFTERGWRGATGLAAIVTLSVSLVNAKAVYAETVFYREFMAGIPSVASGSRVLPVIEGWGEGWGALNGPHGSIEDTYNLAIGGANPLVYAYPFLGTGAYLLTFRQAQPDVSFKWRPDVEPQLVGASKMTDFVVLFGFAGQRKVLAGEMDLCYSGGRLAVFGRRGMCAK